MPSPSAMRSVMCSSSRRSRYAGYLAAAAASILCALSMCPCNATGSVPNVSSACVLIDAERPFVRSCTCPVASARSRSAAPSRSHASLSSNAIAAKSVLSRATWAVFGMLRWSSVPCRLCMCLCASSRFSKAVTRSDRFSCFFADFNSRVVRAVLRVSNSFHATRPRCAHCIFNATPTSSTRFTSSAWIFASTAAITGRRQKGHAQH